MGLTTPIIQKLKSPIDSIRDYKDSEVPKMQQEADEGRTPPNLNKDIEKMEKLKSFADKIPPLVRTVRNTIIAIETAKKIAEAAKDAGKIGSALVPPVAAAGVLQEKIVEATKKEIARAKAELPVVEMLTKELKALAIAVLIALLAIKLKNKNGETSEDDIGDTQNQLDSLLTEEDLSGLDEELGTGVTTITRTTTASGTTTSGGVGGGY
tara:strand:+ start:1849 stop:2478 length:630 start_codon:yes stop_codon:yes gene_type:complete